MTDLASEYLLHLARHGDREYYELWTKEVEVFQQIYLPHGRAIYQIWPKLTESDPALTESNNVQVQQSAQYKCKVIMITSHGNTKRWQEPSGRPREPSGR